MHHTPQPTTPPCVTWSVLGSVILAILPTIAMMHGGSAEDPPPLAVTRCLSLADEHQRTSCYEDLCTPSVACSRSIVAAATQQRGTHEGLEVLHDLMQDDAFPLTQTHAHELAHVIGRETARHTGRSGLVFLSCPEDYAYGCQHGFFEEILATEEEPTRVAMALCGGFEATGQTRSLCFHGAGHGTMMARAFDIQDSLLTCEALGGDQDIADCAQGVFHENIKAFLRGEARAGTFGIHPLLPCSSLAPRHQWACYINHAPYLMARYHHNIPRAARVCLHAEESMIPVCIAEFGQLTTDPLWHDHIRRHRGPVRAVEEEFLSSAIAMCNDVPGGYVADCQLGAVEHLLNYQRWEEGLAYCSRIADSLQDTCFALLGDKWRRALPTEAERDALCAKAPSRHRERCAEGGSDPPPYAHLLPQGEHLPPRRRPILQRITLAYESLLWETGQQLASLLTSLRELASREQGSEPLRGGRDPLPIAVIEFSGGTLHPSGIEIRRSQTVEWRNDSTDLFWPASDVHPTHEREPDFDAGKPLRPGEQWSFLFQRRGTWIYHDHLHPDIRGTVMVR